MLTYVHCFTRAARVFHCSRTCARNVSSSNYMKLHCSALSIFISRASTLIDHIMLNTPRVLVEHSDYLTLQQGIAFTLEREAAQNNTEVEINLTSKSELHPNR